ncbi:hypothetical protein [Streptomyces sp. NPDC059649]|uniref:hypothetical protein n=1 Tax=Streptomyces sp. NPDC059649 TaxID=3346895 RepID=UPI00368183BA
MAGREYQGLSGLRLHLDEPLSPQMARQVARGQLVPVSGEAPDVQDGDKSLVVVHGSEARTVDRVGVHVPDAGDRPSGDDPRELATYAVRRGLLADHASTMTANQLREWLEARDEADEAMSRDDALKPVEDEPEEEPLGSSSDGESQTGNPEATPGGTTEEPGREKPKAADKVDTWRAYAVSQGLDQQLADDMTKADLQAWVADYEAAGE